MPAIVPPNDDAEDRDPLYTDPQFARLYDSNFVQDRADFDFCTQMAVDAASILDLGCGTGALITKLCHGRDVTGVDPAGAMLEIARQQSKGMGVTWVEADARTVRLDRRFDLVFLTGHAFQVFLTHADQRAVLETIANHLSPDGCFIFDTRNPLSQAWKRWTPELTRHRIEHKQLGLIDTWNDVSEDQATGIVSYETHYRIVATGKTQSAVSQIAFPTKETVEGLLTDAGLMAERWLGDWQGNPFNPDTPEIIPIGRLRHR